MEEAESPKSPELHWHAVACTQGKIKYILEKQICLGGGSNDQTGLAAFSFTGHVSHTSEVFLQVSWVSDQTL